MIRQKIRRINNYPWVTYLLLFVMIVIYLLMTVSGGSENVFNLLKFGAQSNQLVRDGQWWRLITPIFVHIGFQHILINGITLYYLGKLIEPIVGHLRYFIIFMVSGVCGNLMSFALGNGISAGSSTAIFGLFGAFLMIAFQYRGNDFVRSTAKTFVLFVVINLVFDIFTPGIDIYGHIGGFIGGYLVSFVVGLRQNINLNKIMRLSYATALIIGIIIMYYLGSVR